MYTGEHFMNLTFASQLFSKLEGRGGKGGLERKGNSSGNERVAGKGEGQDLGEGRVGKQRGQGRRRFVLYLLRLPAPPAPPSLGTFCCGLSTSCA